jgi:glycosyltransferase involved in cell wall biosynthesis
MLGVIAAARSRIPVVVTEHVGFVPYRSLALNAVQRLAWGTVGRATLRAAGAAVAVNDRIASWLRNSTHGLAVRCIANGVCTERFRPEPAAARAATRARFGLPNDRMLALVVAREAEKKNVDAVLRSADSDYHIVVCGAERDLAVPGVTSLGSVPYDDMPSLFAAVDALLHLGVSEGFPVAVQEAMASGLPVVLLWDAAYATVLSAATVEGIPDLASVRPALRGLAADPARRETLGNAARAFAQQQWSWDAVIDAYEAVYAEVVGVVRVPRHAAPLRWPSGEHRAP